MSLDAKERKKLQRIIVIAQKLIAESLAARPGRPLVNGGPKKRIRRSGKTLAQFRRMLKAERKKGVPVIQLARKHGISTAYIYSLP